MIEPGFWLRHLLWQVDQSIATLSRLLLRKPPRVPEHPRRLARPFRTRSNPRHKGGPLVSVITAGHRDLAEQTFGEYETVEGREAATGRYLVEEVALTSRTGLELAVFHAELHGASNAPGRSIVRRDDRRTAFGVRTTLPFANMLGPLEEPLPRSLLVMMPFTIRGGAESLLRTVLAGLKERGWQITLATTRTRPSGTTSTSDWFEALTPHVFDLPRDVPDSADWPDFLDYIIASRRVSRLLVVGSHFAYQQLSRIKTAHAGLKAFDLLFNETGFTDRHMDRLPLFDGTLVESERLAHWLMQRGEAEENIAVVPSGIDLELYKPRETGLRRRIGAESDDLVVGYSSRWSREKAPLDFVAIAERFREHEHIRFVMTGDGILRREVERAVARSKLPSERFHLLEDVPDLTAVLPGYDVMVLPSHVDGRPLVVMEALACGVAVIASRVGALPELVQDGVNGALCHPGDLDGFAEEIAARASRPDVLEQQKRAARKYAQENFDLVRMVDGYERALSKA